MIKSILLSYFWPGGQYKNLLLYKVASMQAEAPEIVVIFLLTRRVILRSPARLINLTSVLFDEYLVFTSWRVWMRTTPHPSYCGDRICS